MFLGQTVLSGVLVMAVYSAKGLSPDLFFPGNPQATSLLRNQGLKVYGGALIGRCAAPAFWDAFSCITVFSPKMISCCLSGCF